MRIPWEARGEVGWGRAFVDTLRLAVRSPSRFYAIEPRDRSPIPALLFGYLFEIPITLGSFVYAKLVGEPELRETLAHYGPQLSEMMPGAQQLLERAAGGSAIVSLLLSPVTYLLEVLLTTAVTWIGLRLSKTLRTSFGTLLRLFAYASWVRVVGLVGIGNDVILSTLAFLMIFGLGSWYWLVIVKQSQRLETWPAVKSSLYGGLVAVAFGCVIGLPLIAIVVLWLMSKVELPKVGQ